MLGLAKNCWRAGAMVSVSFREAREGPGLFAAEPLRAGRHVAGGFEPQVENDNTESALKGRRKGTFAVPLQGTAIILSDSWG